MKQSGVALIAGLALLAAISLLALVSTSGMILQQQMASNQRENERALENSAIASFSATAWLYSRANHEREPDCISDCLLPVGILNPGDLPDQIEYQSAGWWALNGIEAGFNPLTGDEPVFASSSGADAPRWVMEEIHFEVIENAPVQNPTQGVGYYRILGRGTGKHAGKVALTELIIARPWGGDYQLGAFPPGPDPGDFCSQFSELPESALDCGRLAWRQRR